MKRRLALPAAAIVLGACLSGRPALAEEAADPSCTAVLHALEAMSARPRYHWRMSATDPARRRPLEREQIVVDDVLYLTPDQGNWMKLRMSRADRLAMLHTQLARSPITGCSLVGNEDAGGIPTTVYAYSQGDAAGEGQPSAKRIWIATIDGLPRQFRATEGPVSVMMQVEYEHVEAPLP